MIYEAINCIRTQLRTVIPTADIGNIAELSSGNNNPTADPDILISLINVEENRISRDNRNHIQAGGVVLEKNPAIHLYLTLLFSAIKSHVSYEFALQNLQKVILFFQGKYLFDHENTPDDLPDAIEKLILDMVSMNAEQLNNTWSIHGGKYYPSVIYRVTMVTLDSISSQPASLVRTVQTNYVK
jgi:hypothetical protein